MFESEVYVQRRARLKAELKSGVIFFAGNYEQPFNYKSNCFPFRQDSNFLYYVGLDCPSLCFAIDIDNNNEYLFGNDLSLDDIVWTGNQPSIKELASKSAIENTLPLSAVGNFLQSVVKKKQHIHFLMPYQAEVAYNLTSWLGVDILKLKEIASLELASAIVNMRKIKEDREIVQIEKSVAITGDMHRAAMRIGGNSDGDLTERQLGAELGCIAMSKGYYHSFAPIVSTHGEVFHNSPSDNAIKKGKLLLVDAGAENMEHYAGDMTRTIPVGGRFSKCQKDIYDIVLAAQKTVIDSAKPGMLWRDLHFRAAKTITSGLKDIKLLHGDTDEIVASGAYALFFPHGIGHLMGLDVHDMENIGEDIVGYNKEVVRSQQFGLSNLRYALAIESNMVLTDEPGIYFIPQLIDSWKAQKKFEQFIDYSRVDKYRDFGGIRIEDDILITENGCRVLCQGVPKDAELVEEYILSHAY